MARPTLRSSLILLVALGSGCITGEDLQRADRTDASTRTTNNRAPTSTDAGRSDVGVANDSTTCTQSSACTNGFNTCLNEEGGSCSGTNCSCYTSCAFDNPGSGCPQGERCAFLGAGSAVPGKGVCLPSASNAARHGSACQVVVEGGDIVASSCEVGSSCLGTSPSNLNGYCSQFCDPLNPAEACGGLSSFSCLDIDEGYGFCFKLSTVTDVGAPCSQPAQCSTGLCLAGFCTDDCSDVYSICPDNTACLGVDAQGTGACFSTCVANASGDATCAARNPGLVCERIDAASMLDACVPKCASTAECPTGSTCTVATGHCS